MEYTWRMYYSRIKLERRDVRDDYNMETSNYFVETPKYLERQSERENYSLRRSFETALTERKIYLKERDDLLEEMEKRLVRELEDINCHLDQQLANTFIQIRERETYLGSEISSFMSSKVMLNDELQRKRKKTKENGYQAQEMLKKKDEPIRSLRKQIWNHKSKVGKRNVNKSDQDKMFEGEKRDTMDIIKGQLKLKDDQITHLRDQLQQIKSDMTENIDHQRLELERRDKSDRQMKKKLQEKDNQIYDLKEQLQKLTKTVRQSQFEKDEFIASLKRKFQNLEAEIQSFDPKVKYRYKEEGLSRLRTELTQKCERIKVLENTVNVKDDQLIKAKEQLQQSMKTEREKEKEKDEIVTPLHKRIQHLEIEIERRDRKMRDLEAMIEHKKQESTKEENAMRDKDVSINELKEELQHSLRNAQKTEAVLRHNISSLEKENQHLEKKVFRFEPVGNEVNERQIKNDLKEKDDLISDLKDQLQRAEKLMKQPQPETEELVRSLKKKIQQLDAEVESLKHKVKQKEVVADNNIFELTKIRDRNKFLENTVNVKDDQLCKAKNELQKSLKTAHDKEREMDGIISSLNKKIKYLETEAESRDRKLKDLEEVLAYEKDRNRTGSELSKEIRGKEDKIIELKGKLEQTLAKLKKTETELDDTKTRLSKAMGNRLTDNNPNITDLSDKNRPTKLAERYAELYDNQWTDAFDSLQKHFHTEEKVIQSLLQILQNAMHFCITKGHEQLQELQHVLKFSRKNEDDIPADIRKLIKDCRKAMSSAAVRNLCGMYLSDLRQSTDEASRTALSVSSFTEECIEISWFMMVQDPPVVFAHFVSHGDKLNTDLFKPYTTSGTLVDYMVWPALLLHEGGPVLAKGVAQGYGKKSK